MTREKLCDRHKSCERIYIKEDTVNLTGTITKLREFEIQLYSPKKKELDMRYLESYVNWCGEKAF